MGYRGPDCGKADLMVDRRPSIATGRPTMTGTCARVKSNSDDEDPSPIHQLRALLAPHAGAAAASKVDEVGAG